MSLRKPFAVIKVQCREEMPVVVHCGGCLLVVEKVLECWRDTGCWWEGESEKVFYRLLCHDGSVREIFRDLGSGQWFLYKTYD